MAGPKLVRQNSLIWVARSSMPGMNHSALSVTSLLYFLCALLAALPSQALGFPIVITVIINCTCSANHDLTIGPKYDTKYASLAQCKNACQNHVAGCDAINYSKYVKETCRRDNTCTRGICTWWSFTALIPDNVIGTRKASVSSSNAMVWWFVQMSKTSTHSFYRETKSLPVPSSPAVPLKLVLDQVSGAFRIHMVLHGGSRTAFSLSVCFSFSFVHDLSLLLFMFSRSVDTVAQCDPD